MIQGAIRSGYAVTSIGIGVGPDEEFRHAVRGHRHRSITRVETVGRENRRCLRAGCAGCGDGGYAGSEVGCGIAGEEARCYCVGIHSTGCRMGI